ncbi:hypothetical protein HAX54_041414 [Datura stramonium]|uniref:Uncharacterized protein n=1 Tax=Datura stramonium TaxID=4076 RepID=A0ABS8VT21_DATST|nr:hypothetical protein [Datura stramonium]
MAPKGNSKKTKAKKQRLKRGQPLTHKLVDEPTSSKESNVSVEECDEKEKLEQRSTRVRTKNPNILTTMVVSPTPLARDPPSNEGEEMETHPHKNKAGHPKRSIYEEPRLVIVGIKDLPEIYTLFERFRFSWLSEPSAVIA